MPILYLLLALLGAGALLAFLARPGLARALTVWGLAALLPLLGALAAALWAQDRAASRLGTYVPRATRVTLTSGARRQTLTLEPQDAACLERVLRLRSRAVLDTPGGPLTVQPGTRVMGILPPQAVVEALTLRGELTCPHLRRPGAAGS